VEDMWDCINSAESTCHMHLAGYGPDCERACRLEEWVCEADPCGGSQVQIECYFTLNDHQ
jgi:hypothetical protein